MSLYMRLVQSSTYLTSTIRKDTLLRYPTEETLFSNTCVLDQGPDARGLMAGPDQLQRNVRLDKEGLPSTLF